ncbi:MAG TPA: hypothetical protein PKL92_03765 [Aquaticitalea sp.]|nr:hypothetical protein [Aquaticitalea sp.]HNU58529.1 hypothetical protein [Aquaticitalea sp.]
MIVNPQQFNNRLIIGSLLIAVIALAVFGFTNYESAKAHKEFFDKEKKLVETELSQMIARYDEVENTNAQLELVLNEAREATKLALDSLRILKSDLSVISRFKAQVIVLKDKNKELFRMVDSLNNINSNLERDKFLAHNELKKQIDVNQSLLQTNKSLSNTIEKGAQLTANSFKALAYQASYGRLYETKKASKAETVEVCFTLAENALTEKGKKELHIQIVNPKNNVLSDKGAITYQEATLIYSTKTTVDYDNQVLDVCTNIMPDPFEKPLLKGTYHVNVFYKDRKLGSTKFVLN